jgi:hypothetical protein
MIHYNLSRTLEPDQKKLALRIVSLLRNRQPSQAISLINTGKKSGEKAFEHPFIDFLYSKSLDQLSQAGQVSHSPQNFDFSTIELKDKLSNSLADNFKTAVKLDSKCNYKQSGEVRDEPLVHKLLNAKTVAEQEKILPYKGKIFLPTNKYSEYEQVSGIKTTAAFLSRTNMTATNARLQALRSLIDESDFSECLIVANGPSLKHTNIAMYDNAFIIGLNSIFLHPYITPHVLVCEDHLVGEDRSQELNNLDSSIKIIPGYLTYCINPDELTIVLNHRPRISFPVDIDFSANVDEITYTGGTVTYTALQIAIGLGFKNIYLVGVDATYKVENVKKQNDYATGILESLGNDPNHFNSSYFGKGYRWHDPNPLRMMQAYSVAKRYAEYHGINIINITRGGMLEVFKREDYQARVYNNYPKVCIIDWIDISSNAATGEVKKALFKDWPRDKLLHVYSPNALGVTIYKSSLGDVFGPDHPSILPAWKTIIENNPSGIYWRPTHNRPILNLFTALLLSIEKKPYALHLMDYWTVKVVDSELRSGYERALEYSIKNSAHIFAISQRMKSRISEKYAIPRMRVTVAHNYSPASLESRVHPQLRKEGKRLIFYSGNLDPDQSIEPLVDICKAIEVLNRRGSARFEFIIRTSDFHIRSRGHLFGDYDFVKLQVQSGDFEEYTQQMAQSDLCIVCYGFSSSARAYLQDSIANKLPDLITANAKFFAYGDHEVGTLSYLLSIGYPFIETKRDISLIAEHIQKIASMNYHEYVDACSESFLKITSEFSEMAQCHVFQKQLSACTLERKSNSHLAGTYQPLVSVYQDLLSCSGVYLPEGMHQELELMRFLANHSVVANSVYQFVRDHGISWSINPTKSMLEENLSSILDDQELFSKSLAWMIATQRHDRFAELWSQLFRIIVQPWSGKTSQIGS